MEGGREGAKQYPKYWWSYCEERGNVLFLVKAQQLLGCVAARTHALTTIIDEKKNLSFRKFLTSLIIAPVVLNG